MGIMGLAMVVRRSRGAEAVRLEGLEAGVQRREFRQVIVPINNTADPPTSAALTLSLSLSFFTSLPLSFLSWTLILLKEYNKPRSVLLVYIYINLPIGR